MKKILYSELNPLGSVLDSVVNDLNLSKGIQKNTLFKFWSKIVGKKFEKLSKPISINQRDELIVACANSMVTSELLLFKTDILKKMEPYTKPLKIKIVDIVFSHKIWRDETKEEIPDYRAPKSSIENINLDGIELDESEVANIKMNIESNTFASPEQRDRMFEAIVKDLKYQKYKELHQ